MFPVLLALGIVAVASRGQAAPIPGPPFNLQAAHAALSAVRYQDCGGNSPGGVVVTFGPTGAATGASVFGDWDQNVRACVANRFRIAKVPPFGGAPVKVRWRIVF